MSEKEQIFNSQIKSKGIFNFKEYYRFCYGWLVEEANLSVLEDNYEEKIEADSKIIVVKWTGIRKVTDYFKFEVKIEFKVTGMKDVEAQQGNTKIKTNTGTVTTKVKGILVRDYQGKFESTAFNKFLRSIYEKWVIPSRIEQYEDKLIGDLDEFLAQAKSYLALEGKK